MIDIKSFINVGQSAAVDEVVTWADSAENYGTGNLGDILATPALVNWIIKATTAFDSSLPEGFATVGTALQLAHIAPTIIGSSVRVEVEVAEIFGHSVIFSIKAYDNVGEIASGRYERAVVVRDELQRRAHERVAAMVKAHP